MTLEEGAMEYAIINLDVSNDEKCELLQTKLIISHARWSADDLRNRMEKRFSPWLVQEAIKEAQQTLKLLGLEQPD